MCAGKEPNMPLLLISDLPPDNKRRKTLGLLEARVNECRYTGNDRDKLIPNTLFRVGAAAAILTNKPEAKQSCKYELKHVARVHLGADPIAYK